MYPQIDVEPFTKPAVKAFVERCQGGRKYMEDCHCIAYQEKARKDAAGKDLEYVYFGVFDGHGGKEAAIFTKDNLLSNIVSQRNFWSSNDSDVLEAIKEGFITTHYAMMKEVVNWPKTSLGLPSTSGTTASVCFLMRNKYYIGHVGDSRIVLVREDCDEMGWHAIPLTKDHKPDSSLERNRIIEAGGKVMNKSGVERVVWNRPRCGHKGPVRRSTHIDEIPFLAVARSLGDLWSYNSSTDTFVVSPVPDVSVLSVSAKDVCLLLASDGLWNMFGEHESVDLLYDFEQNRTENIPLECLQENDKCLNPAQLLVECALQRWSFHNLRADNITAVVAFFNKNTSNDNFETNTSELCGDICACNPTIVSTSFGGEYFIPTTQQLEQNLPYDSDDFSVSSKVRSVSTCRVSCEYTELQSSRDAVDLFNSSLSALESFQKPLQTINDNEANCKLVQEKSEQLEDLKQRNKVDNVESSSRRNSVLNSENDMSDVFVNTNATSENDIVHRCTNEYKERKVRRSVILQTSLRGSFNSGRINKRKWEKLSTSPPAKRLRSSTWSRAKVSLPSILTRAVAASLLTRSRLRAIKGASKSF